VPDTAQPVTFLPADATVSATGLTVATSASGAQSVMRAPVSDTPQAPRARLSASPLPIAAPGDLSAARSPMDIQDSAQTDPPPDLQRSVRPAPNDASGPVPDQPGAGPKQNETLEPVMVADAGPMVGRAEPPVLNAEPVPPDQTAPMEPVRRRGLPHSPPGLDVAVPSQTLPVTPESTRPAPKAGTVPARTEPPQTTGPARTPLSKPTGDESTPFAALRERDAPAVPIRDVPVTVNGNRQTADTVEPRRHARADADSTGAVVSGEFPRPDKPDGSKPAAEANSPPAVGDAAPSVLPAEGADPRAAATTLPAGTYRPSLPPLGSDRRAGEKQAVVGAGTGPETGQVSGTGGAKADQRPAEPQTAVPVIASDPSAAHQPPWGRDLPDQGIAPAAMQGPFPDRIASDHADRTVSEGSRPVQTPMPVSVQIAEAAGSMGDGRIELTLSPEELGQVRLHLTTTETTAIVAVSADRADTLDLIRRHLDDLTRDFRALGYQDVSFQLSHGDPGQQHGRTDPGNPQAKGDLPNAPEAQSAATYRSALSSPVHGDAGLDLRL
jgi:flagellar hook-length control protein FliK